MSTSPTPNVMEKSDFKLGNELIMKINKIAVRFPEKKSALIPSLHLIQDEFGWVPPETVKQLAEILNSTPNKIYAVLTFYTMFNTQPVGKYHVQVCRNVSCSLLGAKSIVEHISEKYGIKILEKYWQEENEDFSDVLEYSYKSSKKSLGKKISQILDYVGLN